MLTQSHTTCKSQCFIFNLVYIFVIFVQFSPNFIPLEIETKFNFYIKIIMMKILIYLIKNVNFNIKFKFCLNLKRNKIGSC